MEHSILTKLTGTKSTSTTKAKKKVHWCKKLEEIHVFEPELVNITQRKTLFSSTSETASSLDNQDQSTNDLQRIIRIQNTASKLHVRLEKLSMATDQNYSFTNDKVMRRKDSDSENSFFGEDWV